MKCMDCCYEIPCDAYEKDERLDSKLCARREPIICLRAPGLVIYVKEDIRFRMRFLSKCHVPVKLTGDNAYAVSCDGRYLLPTDTLTIEQCIFCVESCHTIEDNDATGKHFSYLCRDLGSK
jgi:hypothetical protein